ncbi:MAG: ATP-binding protein [Aureliella sp.]
MIVGFQPLSPSGALLSMQWSDLIGHEQQKEWFARAVARGRLANTFLFLGPDGVGKRTFARLLAKSLLCRRSNPAELSPCGACEDCAQVDALTHPDLIEVTKPADKATLPLEAIIGPPEARRTAGLCHDISLRPYGGRRKFAILDDADALAVDGANALLKTLEEPPLDSVLILISVSLQKQLPTIRSRSQIVRFQPLPPGDLARLILEQGLCTTPERAHEIAMQSDGGLTMARTLADDELATFRTGLLTSLARSQLDFIGLAKAIGALSDAGGKESIVRRPRTKLLLKMTADFYRAVALQAQGGPPSGDPALQQAVEARLADWPGGIEAAVECWNRCLEAIAQVDRNANQITLLETWSANLAASTRT